MSLLQVAIHGNEGLNVDGGAIGFPSYRCNPILENDAWVDHFGVRDEVAPRAPLKWARTIHSAD